MSSSRWWSRTPASSTPPLTPAEVAFIREARMKRFADLIHMMNSRGSKRKNVYNNNAKQVKRFRNTTNNQNKRNTRNTRRRIHTAAPRPWHLAQLFKRLRGTNANNNRVSKYAKH